MLKIKKFKCIHMHLFKIFNTTYQIKEIKNFKYIKNTLFI